MPDKEVMPLMSYLQVAEWFGNHISHEENKYGMPIERRTELTCQAQRDADLEVLKTALAEALEADSKVLEAKLKTMRQIWETEFLSALAAKKKEWKLEEADLLRKLNAILKTGNIDPVYETLEAHIAQLRKESEEESCQKK